MKITKYEKLMLQIEELAKDKEANAVKLNALSLKLAAQNEKIKRVSVQKIERKLKNKDLTYAEFYNLKDLLVEKKAYEKNAALIEEVIAGNYDNVHQKRKRKFRIFAKHAVGAVVLGALAASVAFCCKQTGMFNNSSKIVQTNDEKGDKKEDNNKDNKDNKTSSENETDSLDTEDSLAKDDEEDKDKTDKDEKDEEEKDKKDEEEKDKKDEEEKDKKQKDGNGVKPKDETTTTDNKTQPTTEKGKTTSKVIPEKKEKVDEDGDLPVQPTTEDQTDKNKPKINPGKDEEEKPSEDVPSMDNVDEDEKDETTHDIPDKSNPEPEGKKPAPKEDTTEEDKPSEDVPSMDNIDEDEKDETTYDIPDDKDKEKKPELMPGTYEDTYEEEKPSEDVPSMDNVDEDGYIIVHFDPKNDEKTNTTNKENVSNTSEKDKEKTNTTNTSEKDKEKENQNTVDVTDDVVVTPSDTTYFNYEDTYEEEEAQDFTPSFDNIDEDEEDEEFTYVSSNGKTYTLYMA